MLVFAGGRAGGRVGGRARTSGEQAETAGVTVPRDASDSRPSTSDSGRILFLYGSFVYTAFSVNNIMMQLRKQVIKKLSY